MEIHSTEFVGSFPSLKNIPNLGLPEVAFIGRSNVGKSSLINTLLGNRKLAKISGTPGKTRLINLFNINEKVLFVDLPGYGYAKVSKRERAIWQEMIENYLLNSEHLQLLVQLVDARHGLLPNDHQMHEWTRIQKLPHCITLTKADKMKKNDLAKLRRATQLPDNELAGAIPTSAQNKLGIKDLWSVIDQVIS
jgi:GTP-binding protein